MVCVRGRNLLQSVVVDWLCYTDSLVKPVCACTYVHTYVHFRVHIAVCLCLCVFLSVCLCVCLSVCLCVCLSVCLSVICQFIGFSICWYFLCNPWNLNILLLVIVWNHGPESSSHYHPMHPMLVSHCIRGKTARVLVRKRTTRELMW